MRRFIQNNKSHYFSTKDIHVMDRILIPIQFLSAEQVLATFHELSINFMQRCKTPKRLFMLRKVYLLRKYSRFLYKPLALVRFDRCTLKLFNTCAQRYAISMATNRQQYLKKKKILNSTKSHDVTIQQKRVFETISTKSHIIFFV